MDIEKNIKILEKFKNNEMQRDKLERDNRCGGWKIGDIYKKLELDIAIEHILAEREEDKKKIEELEKKNRIYALEGSKIALELHIKDNYIPKQKVKEVIKKIKEILDIAEEQIESKIIIADSDSLNFGRKQAHGKDIELIERLLEDK